MTSVFPFTSAPSASNAGPLAWAVALGLAGLGLLTANPLLTAACVLAVPLFVHMLWRQGEPPVLLFLVSFQWLQVSTKVFNADILGVSVDAMSTMGGTPVARAVWLSLTALVVLALGQRVMLTRVPVPQAEAFEQDQQRFSGKSVFKIYTILFIISLLLQSVAFVFLPLSQIVFALGSLKWIMIFVMANIVISRREGWGWLWSMIAIELVMGFGGYFSGFKAVFFVCIVAALAAPRGLTGSQKRFVALAGASLFILSTVWQGVKVEYRTYLNQGSQAQVVLVSWEDRLNEIWYLAGELDMQGISDGVVSGFERVAYVDMFSEVLSYVPRVVPHSNGDLWWGAVQHVITPRVLFPNKPILESDSELSMKYTGLRMASGEEGTSISLGYVADSYIDFGVWGMWIPIFGMGLLQGFIYMYFLNNTPSILFGYGFALVALLPGLAFESPAVKFLGGTLFLLLAYGFFVRFVGERFIRLATVRPVFGEAVQIRTGALNQA